MRTQDLPHCLSDIKRASKTFKGIEGWMSIFVGFRRYAFGSWEHQNIEIEGLGILAFLGVPIKHINAYLRHTTKSPQYALGLTQLVVAELPAADPICARCRSTRNPGEEHPMRSHGTGLVCNGIGCQCNGYVYERKSGTVIEMPIGLEPVGCKFEDVRLLLAKEVSK